MIFNIGFAALGYEDLNKEHWAYSSVENLVKKGIIKENSYKFNGEDPVSRYEFAYDLSKMLDKIELDKVFLKMYIINTQEEARKDNKKENK